ncbi:unnamed protein product [Effrenium voratum]|nr:unnamed protein product [Effrenium voratum]
MAMKLSKDSGSTTASQASLTPGSSRNGADEIQALRVPRAPADRLPASGMTGNFRRRKYCLPQEYASLEVNAAAPVDSSGEQLRAQRDQFMQVTIEGTMQKRSYGMWWTSYWVVLDQTAIRFYENEQASISRPNHPEEEIALPLLPELSTENPSWVICRDAHKRKVLHLRSWSDPACWEDVATARLWCWALSDQRDDGEARSSQ